MMGSSNRRANGPILPVSNAHRSSDHRRSTGSNRPHASSQRQSRQPKQEEGPKMRAAVRGHFVAMSGEFVGTTMFLLLAFAGTQIANSIAPPTNTDPVLALLQLLFISMSFGFSLAVNVWVFFRISGGLFNPAVTLALCIGGAVPWVRGALLFIPQMLGGIVAAALVSCLTPGDLPVATTLSHGTSTAQGLFIEMFLTAMLIITVLMLAAEKNKATFIAPVGIGLALFVCELAGVYYTGGSLNPTRSFGVHCVTRDWPGYHWIYWIGPLLGALIASGYYKFAKYMNYEDAVPGQDATDEEEQEMQQARSRSRSH